MLITGSDTYFYDLSYLSAFTINLPATIWKLLLRLRTSPCASFAAVAQWFFILSGKLLRNPLYELVRDRCLACWANRYPPASLWLGNANGSVHRPNEQSWLDNGSLWGRRPAILGCWIATSSVGVIMIPTTEITSPDQLMRNVILRSNVPEVHDKPKRNTATVFVAYAVIQFTLILSRLLRSQESE